MYGYSQTFFIILDVNNLVLKNIEIVFSYKKTALINVYFYQFPFQMFTHILDFIFIKIFIGCMFQIPDIINFQVVKSMI